jgi:hypothetical protein
MTQVPGWNDTGRYSTRFRERVLVAKSATIAPEDWLPLHTAVAHLAEQQNNFAETDGSPLCLDPFASYLAAGDNDTLNFDQMLTAADRPQFQLGMQEDVMALVKNDLFDILLAFTVPLGNKVVSAIWSFK